MSKPSSTATRRPSSVYKEPDEKKDAIMRVFRTSEFGMDFTKLKTLRSEKRHEVIRAYFSNLGLEIAPHALIRHYEVKTVITPKTNRAISSTLDQEQELEIFKEFTPPPEEIPGCRNFISGEFIDEERGCFEHINDEYVSVDTLILGATAGMLGWMGYKGGKWGYNKFKDHGALKKARRAALQGLAQQGKLSVSFMKQTQLASMAEVAMAQGGRMGGSFTLASHARHQAQMALVTETALASGASKWASVLRGAQMVGMIGGRILGGMAMSTCSVIIIFGVADVKGWIKTSDLRFWKKKTRRVHNSGSCGRTLSRCQRRANA